MASRERVIKVLNHQETDRVPIDLGSNRSTGIMVSAYNRFKRHLGIKDSRNRVCGMKQMLAIVEELVMKKFGIDVIPLFRAWYLPYPINPYSDKWGSWQLFNGTDVEIPSNYTPKEVEKGNLILLDENGDTVGGYYFDYPRLCTNLLEVSKQEKVSLKEYEPSRGFCEEELKRLQDKVECFFKSTDYAILGDSGFLGLGDGSFRVMTKLYNIGYTDWMIMLLTEPGYVKEILDKTVNFWIQNLRLYNQAIDDKICAIAFADDVGT